MPKDFAPKIPEITESPEIPEITEPSNALTPGEAASIAEEMANAQKTGPEIQAENEVLRTENETLRTENAQLANDLSALLQKVPVRPPVRPGFQTVFIKSNGVPAVPRNGKKYLEGSVNGQKFEVLCDHQIKVSDAIAEALAGVIRNQS